MAIKGSLKEASLPDVIQLLYLGRRTGCLAITDRQNLGYIYFDGVEFGPQTAPRPVFRTARQVRAQGIPLDVAADGVKVLVLLDGKRFVRSLVKVPLADAVPE